MWLWMWKTLPEDGNARRVDRQLERVESSYKMTETMEMSVSVSRNESLACSFSGTRTNSRQSPELVTELGRTGVNGRIIGILAWYVRRRNNIKLYEFSSLIKLFVTKIDDLNLGLTSPSIDQRCHRTSFEKRSRSRHNDGLRGEGGLRVTRQGSVGRSVSQAEGEVYIRDP
jgi:hypothetical protein